MSDHFESSMGRRDGDGSQDNPPAEESTSPSEESLFSSSFRSPDDEQVGQQDQIGDVSDAAGSEQAPSSDAGPQSTSQESSVLGSSGSGPEEMSPSSSVDPMETNHDETQDQTPTDNATSGHSVDAAGAGDGGGGNEQPTAGSSDGRPSWLIPGAVAVAALLVLLVVVVIPGNDEPDYLAAAETGPYEFLQATTETVSEEVAATLGQIDEALADADIAIPSPIAATVATIINVVDTSIEVAEEAGLPVISPRSPAGVGLYGGSGVNACDEEELITFLQENPDKGEAFASVNGIALADIPRFINGLSEGFLLHDTPVINHGFRNGVAYGFETTLEAGTAVLVDDDGVPRVRCKCGNPLLSPFQRQFTEFAEGTVILEPNFQDQRQAFPFGVPGSVSVSLGPASDASADQTDELYESFEGGTAVVRSLQIQLGDGDIVDLGEVVLPDQYPVSLIQNNANREFVIQSKDRNGVRLMPGGSPGFSPCTYSRTGEAVGGWEFTGAAGEIRVSFMVETGDSDVDQVGILVSFVGPADVRFVSNFEEIVEDPDRINDECTPIEDNFTSWGWGLALR